MTQPRILRRGEREPAHPPAAHPVAGALLEAADRLRAELAASNLGFRLRGARAVYVDTAAGSGGTVRPLTSAGRLLGFGLLETTGAAAASVMVLEGRDATVGELRMPITLSAGQSASDWFGPEGIGVGDGGLFLTVTGAVRGSLYVATFDPPTV